MIDIIEEFKINKIDLIKSDVEGAERYMVKDLIKICEKYIFPKELLKAEEVFLTGTAVEITPVSQIDKKKFKIGSVTKKLIYLFNNLVGKIK